VGLSEEQDEEFEREYQQMLREGRQLAPEVLAERWVAVQLE
jgi:hypothetical protein